MRKRILSIWLSVCMMLTMLPISAMASGQSNTYGDFSVTVNSGTAPTYDNGVLTFGTAGAYTVGMAEGKSSTPHRIVVNATGAVTLNFNGVNITAPKGTISDILGKNALTVTSGTVTVNVIANSALTGGAGEAPPSGAGGAGGAGISGNVTVTGTATLTATGGNGVVVVGEDPSGAGGAGIFGTLTVTGSATVSLAGGYSRTTTGSALTGTLTATGFVIKGGSSANPTEVISASTTSGYRYITVEPDSLPPVSQAQWGEAGSDGAKPTAWTYGTLDDAMSYANNLVSGTAYIQLREDVNVTEALVFATGTTTILDLNGKDIDRGLTAKRADGNVINVSGNLTLKDSSTDTVANQGKITGGFSSAPGFQKNYDGGCVDINAGASFTMQGGNITGNRTTYNSAGGGGVVVGSNGSFIMMGGSIADNEALYWGGGVFVSGSFTMLGGSITGNKSANGGVYFDSTNFTVGGTAVIDDNMVSGSSTERNVMLTGKTISVHSTTPLASGASIGVTAKTAPTSGSPGSVTGTNSANYSGYFFSDDNSYIIQTGTNNVVQLAVAPLVIGTLTISDSFTAGHDLKLSELDSYTPTITKNDDAAAKTDEGWQTPNGLGEWTKWSEGDIPLNTSGTYKLRYYVDYTCGSGPSTVYSNAVTLTVVGNTTALTLTATPESPQNTETSVTLTATLTGFFTGPGVNNQTITFKSGSTTLGTAKLNAAGVATYTWTPSVAGSYSLTAEYAATAYNTTATSSALSYTVEAILPTVAEYAADAVSGTDYVLDGTILTIKTAKGAAFWSASGTSYLSYTILLENTVDVGGFSWMPVGTGNLDPFAGTFDGQGHSITGLTVDISTSDSAYAGLFGYVQNATIKNVGLIGAQVSAESSSNSAFAGGIVGNGDIGTSILNSYCTGSVSSVSGSNEEMKFVNAGGIAGRMQPGANAGVRNCYSGASVSAATTGTATLYAGGLVGLAVSGPIVNSYYLPGSVTPDKAFNTSSNLTITGCGTFDVLGALTAGTEAQFRSAQTLTFGNDLLTALNGWVSGQASTAYHTWQDDSAPKVNGGYPVFGPAWADPQAQWGVAGAENAAPGTWVGSGSLTDAVAYANGLASGTAYIKLLDNVDTTAMLKFEEDKTTVLDLNGKTIDRGLSAATMDGNVITAEGALIIKDSSTADVSSQGRITGGYNSSNNGGGVSVWNAGTVTLQGGNITNNKSTGIWGGGVRVSPFSSFIMQGGSITGNVAYDEGGGGVGNEGTFTMTGGSIAGNSCISSGTSSVSLGGGVLSVGEFNMSGGSITGNSVDVGGAGGGVLTNEGMTLSGNVNISSNTVGTASDNVALMPYSGHSPSIDITGALTNSTAIGVSIVTLSRDNVFTRKSGEFTFGDVVTNSDYISKFVSDDSNFAVIADGSQLKLAAAQAITKADATNGIFSVRVNGNEIPSAIEGQTVTVTPTANSGYTLDTITICKTGDKSTTVTVSSNSFTMPAYAVTVKVTFKVVAEAPSGGGTPTGGGSAPTGAPVIVDGKTKNIGTEKKSGDTTTVTVDQLKLGTNIGGAASGSSVVVPVSENGSATASLVVKNIEDMAAKSMTLTVKTGSVAYNLNTSAIDTTALVAAFPGADMSTVPFHVTISNSALSIEGETLVLSPVGFTVTATYNGQTVSVDTFSAYIDRVIEITKEQAAKITTAVVVNADGSVRHVPTNVIEKDGKYYAVINSRTNSSYALIQSEVTFADAKGKWYEAGVNEMGSRKIITGRSADLFDGEASVTRAEFSAILVRALGLPTDGTSTFSDVPAGAWYTGAVATAVQYGLTEGKGDNCFDPSAAITRQEAMLMLQRAASLTEFTGASSDLKGFADANSIGSWALDAAKWSVGSGLIQGSGGKLHPTANITRAESATSILRLLQKAELVDVRSKT